MACGTTPTSFAADRLLDPIDLLDPLDLLDPPDLPDPLDLLDLLDLPDLLDPIDLSALSSPHLIATVVRACIESIQPSFTRARRAHYANRLVLSSFTQNAPRGAVTPESS